MFDFLSRRRSELNRRRERRAVQAQVEAMEPRTMLSVEAVIGAPTTGYLGQSLAVCMSADCCGSCGSCGTITHWVIDWNDGNTQTISGNPGCAAHPFATIGTFNISATAYADDDTSETVGTTTEVADSGTVVASVDASGPAIVGVPFALSMSAYFCATYGVASSQTNIDHWQIDWGDGNSTTTPDNAGSAVHTYATAQEYTISATAMTPGGWTATKSCTLAVTAQGTLTASINASTPVPAGTGLPLSLIANFTPASGLPSGLSNIDHWQITWGDGSAPETISGNPGSASHPYPAAGGYSISATATTAGGVTSDPATGTAVIVDAGSLIVSVNTSAPGFVRVDFPLSMSACFCCTYGSPSSQTAIDHWQIDWGDGYSTTTSGSATGATHPYTTAGGYTISATAFTVGNLSVTATGSATVSEQGTLYGAISASTPAFTQEDVTLSMSAGFCATAGLPAGLGDIDHWQIDWGDGNSATISAEPGTPAPVHPYAAAGGYTISGTVTTVGGVETTMTCSVVVRDRPVVSVEATDASASEDGCDPGTFTISRTGDTSQGLIVYFSLGGSAIPGTANTDGTYSPGLFLNDGTPNSNGTDYTVSGATFDTNSGYWIAYIGQGATSATVTVTPVNDAQNEEGTENIQFTLQAPPAGPGLYFMAEGDDDAAISVDNLQLTVSAHPAGYFLAGDIDGESVAAARVLMSQLGVDDWRVREAAQTDLKDLLYKHPELLPLARAQLETLRTADTPDPEAITRLEGAIHEAELRNTVPVTASVEAVGGETTFIISLPTNGQTPGGLLYADCSVSFSISDTSVAALDGHLSTNYTVNADSSTKPVVRIQPSRTGTTDLVVRVTLRLTNSSTQSQPRSNRIWEIAS